jgi:predicted transcriptional regulator
MTGRPRAKELVRLAINRLPEDCTYEDIMYEVYVLGKIAVGVADVEAGRTIPHEEVMREFAEWRESIGR